MTTLGVRPGPDSLCEWEPNGGGWMEGEVEVRERTLPGNIAWERKEGQCHFFSSSESDIDLTMIEFAHIFETDFVLINLHNNKTAKLLSGNEKN